MGRPPGNYRNQRFAFLFAGPLEATLAHVGSGDNGYGNLVSGI